MMQIHKRDWARRMLLLGWVAGFFFYQVGFLWSQFKSISPVKKRTCDCSTCKICLVSPTGYQSLVTWSKKYGFKA